MAAKTNTSGVSDPLRKRFLKRRWTGWCRAECVPADEGADVSGFEMQG